MPQTLPSEIHDKLHATRSRLRFVDLGLGLARAILAVAIVLVTLFALDTMLEPPLLVVRAFALFMGLVAFTGVAVFMAKPMRRSLSDDHVALLVEEEFPELEGGLVSSVQLSRELGRDDLYTSRALIQATIDRTAKDVGTLEFGRVVPAGQLTPIWGLLVASGLGVGLMLTQPEVREYVKVFTSRVIEGVDARYPSLVQLQVRVARHQILEGSDRVYQVAKGDDLDVDVLVTKGAHLVDRLLIHSRYDGVVGTETRDLVKYDENYRKSFRNVTEPFSFYVEDPVHGVDTVRHQVLVVQRPWVEQYEFMLTYPEYTGKSAEVVRQPDLQVPIGTQVSYAVVSNKPLQAARLVFERDEGGKKDKQGRREKTRVVAVEAQDQPKIVGDLVVGASGDALGSKLEDLAGVGELGPTAEQFRLGEPGRGERTAVGKFVVGGDMRFRFHLVSSEGLETGTKPVVFSVRAVPDRKPVVTIPVPGRRKLVTPQAKVPVVVEARDDYGVKDVVLLFQVERSEESEPGASQTIQLEGVTEGARSLRLDYTLDVADQRLQPGDRLRYRAKAYDQNLDPAKNFKESRPYEVQVVRPEDLERILQDRITGVRERLEAARKEQLGAQKSAQEFMAKLGPENYVLSDDDKRALQRVDYDQRRVTNRLGDVKKELDDIRAERQLNRLTDEAALELVSELLAGVADLADRASPLVSRELEDGRSAPRLDGRTRSRLVRVPDLQQEIAEAIEALVARIEKWGDFTEALQELRDVLQGEKGIIDGTEEAVKKKHN